MNTLVTGANGFVGAALCKRLLNDGVSFRCTVRSHSLKPAIGQTVSVGDISAETNWLSVLENVEKVVHLAARVHVMTENSNESMAEFRRVNVEGTAKLATQAAMAGVKRFVFLSSIKVNGEFTEFGKSFTANDEPSPRTPYGKSKNEAEQLLRRIASETGMEVVIIRPPLVYGPQVRANFRNMMRCLERGIPLPLAALTENRRSLVALDNLVDLMVTCLHHQAAANQTFLVSDGNDISTAELLKRIGYHLRRPARLFYVPTGLLKLVATVLNKHDIYQRLCGSLQVDITKTRQLLQWSPPISVDDGLARTVEGFNA